MRENRMLTTPDGKGHLLIPDGCSDRHFMAHGFQYATLPSYLRHTGTDPLSDGSWGGQRCFVVGCGPSLQGFDFERLRGEKVITINTAFFFVPFADISISADARWLNETVGGVYGDDVAGAYKQFAGIKLFVNRDWLPRPPGVQEVLTSAQRERFSPSIHAGLGMGGNSAFPAINLALTLGATDIHLLGLDMTDDLEGGKHHFFDMPNVEPVAPYAPDVAGFAVAAKDVPAMWPNVRIIQTNRNSNLNCFEFGDLPV